MRNKENTLRQIEKLKNNIKNINYIINTNGNFQQLQEAFQVATDTLDNIENLVNIEPDDFRTNQII